MLLRHRRLATKASCWSLAGSASAGCVAASKEPTRRGSISESTFSPAAGTESGCWRGQEVVSGVRYRAGGGPDWEDLGQGMSILSVEAQGQLVGLPVPFRSQPASRGGAGRTWWSGAQPGARGGHRAVCGLPPPSSFSDLETSADSVETGIWHRREDMGQGFTLKRTAMPARGRLQGPWRQLLSREARNPFCFSVLCCGLRPALHVPADCTGRVTRAARSSY